MIWIELLRSVKELGVGEPERNDLTFNNIKWYVRKAIKIIRTCLLKYVKVTWEGAVMDVENLLPLRAMSTTNPPHCGHPTTSSI